MVGAFKRFSCIEWKQSTNIQEGDIVYIYVGSPYKEIKYRCIATKVDLPNSVIDDSKFILDGSAYRDYGRYMRLKLIREYETQQYKYEELKQHGLKSVQGPSRVCAELALYIEEKEIEDLKGSLPENDKEDNSLIDGLKELPAENIKPSFEYQGKTKKKQAAKVRNGIRIYSRDKATAINALAHAQYLCEIDSCHPTFIRKHININYTEPHHLIPMAYSDLFNVSLDVEENIVSLCSNCHNQLHYGRDIEGILRKLYALRVSHLNKVGIYITVEELLKMYGLC